MRRRSRSKIGHRTPNRSELCLICLKVYLPSLRQPHFRTCLRSTGTPSRARGKGGEANDEIAPQGKRKRHPANEADSWDEDAPAPPPKKKTLKRLVKGIRESDQGISPPESYSRSPLCSRSIDGVSRGYCEVKEVSGFEGSPPRHSQIGHQAKGERHRTNKPDSKSEDVAPLIAKQNAQDARMVKSLRGSTKSIPLSKFAYLCQGYGERPQPPHVRRLTPGAF